MRKIEYFLASFLTFLIISSSSYGGETFNSIKKRGFIKCGVNVGLAGFSNTDKSGKWEGIDVDICRAVSAAVFGDPNKIEFTPLNASQRMTALQTGEIDVLSRNTTWTATRDTKLSFNFIGVTYYDGQGFMIRKDMNITSSKQLDGATVCVEPGTTTELNLADYFRSHNMKFESVVIQNVKNTTAAFFSGRCDVYTADLTILASARAVLAPNPDDYIILPEVISKEPLGPAVRHGDDQWFDIVKWSFLVMVDAEEKNITQANVDQMLKSSDPKIKRLLGVTPGIGQSMGLSDRWAYHIIKYVGNYGESFHRNLTKKLNLKRGFNNLWTKGGLMYAYPIR